MAQETADEQLTRLANRFIQDQLFAHPVMATEMGIHRDDDQLDHFNRFAIREELEQIRAFLHQVDPLSVAEMSAEKRVDYRLIRSHAQKLLFALEHQKWYERQPGAYLDTVLYGLLGLILRDYAPADSRGLSLLGRLRALPLALAEALRNLARPPRPFVEAALQSAGAADLLFTQTLPEFFAALPSERQRRSLEIAADKARAAVAEYARSLKEIFLKDAPDRFALGRDWFDYQLRIEHLMEENGDDLIRIGRDEMAQTRRELERIAERIKPGEDWRTLALELALQHPDAGGLLGAYRSEMERAREFVKEHTLVPLPENESLQMLETPAFARPLYPYAAYVPPALYEPKSNGLFWVTPIDRFASEAEQSRQLQGHSLHQLPVIALHEAYPGHHLQMSLAAQHPNPLRRFFAGSNLLIEGWALYCEEMMGEAGFYRDDRTRLMQLKARLWRACRVVLDVQLHSGEMLPEEAVQFLVSEAGLERVHAESEVRRYLQTPTQPMTYTLGRRAILGLREEIKRKEGSRFQLRDFHQRLLSHGSLPPSLLRSVLLDA